MNLRQVRFTRRQRWEILRSGIASRMHGLACWKRERLHGHGCGSRNNPYLEQLTRRVRLLTAMPEVGATGLCVCWRDCLLESIAGVTTTLKMLIVQLQN